MKGGTYKVILVLFGLILLGLFLWLLSTTTHASSQLVINEICPKPESGNAWIEFYNPTESAIDLFDYSIEDGTHKPKTFGHAIISPQDYLVIEKSSPDGFGFVLNTASAELVILKNNTVTVDQVSYGGWDDPIYDHNPDDDPPIPSQGKSLARIPNGFDTNDDQADFRILFPSKGLENKLPVYSNQILLNEIVPAPATGSADEFFELWNSSSSEIDLSGWQLDDISGGSSPYTIPDSTIISPEQYLAFYNSITHISLNDSGDSARLLDPNGDLKDTITYDKAKRGQSYSKFGDTWLWTTTLTPQAINIFTADTPVNDADPVLSPISIQKARSLPEDTTVVVTGIITVAPGILSAQYFYIQDDTGGLQIYNYEKAFPALKPGDIVQVTGVLVNYQSERRLKTALITDIVITGSRPPPIPTELKIDDLNENYEGQYISVIGTVTKTSGDTFYIHGSGELKVIIRGTTGIDKPRMSVGEKVEIAGIFSQYGEEYRILPTVQDDVKIIGQGGRLPNSGSDLFIPIFVSLFLTFLIYYGKNITQLKRD